MIAIGDLHGDYDNAIKLLQRVGILNKKLKWIAKDTILVQLGDIFDRGHQEEKLLNFLLTLSSKAKQLNSEFYMIHGNHY